MEFHGFILLRILLRAIRRNRIAARHMLLYITITLIHVSSVFLFCWDAAVRIGLRALLPRLWKSRPATRPELSADIHWNCGEQPVLPQSLKVLLAAATAASRTRPWPLSGWECRDRRLSRGRKNPDTPCERSASCCAATARARPSWAKDH